jgi:hypothetical protein
MVCDSGQQEVVPQSCGIPDSGGITGRAEDEVSSTDPGFIEDKA